jgi:Flp pilus assembly protein TadD
MTREKRSKAGVVFFLLLSGSVWGGCRTAPLRPAEPATLEQAYAFLRAGRPGKAHAVLTDILRAYPADGRARRELAYLYIRQKRWKEAVQQLGRALEDEPNDMRLRMDLGYARQACGETDSAADEFRLVLREPGEFQDQARSALDGLQDAVRDGGTDSRKDHLLNAGYDALRRGDQTAARAHFESALAADPGQTVVYKQLGYMSLARGDLAKAAESFAGAHQLSPLDDATALQLGYVYDRLHNRVKAEAAFTSALRSPDERVRDAAQAALDNIQAARKRLYLDLNASPFSTARFSNRIAYLESQLGLRPRVGWPMSLYLVGRYTQDTRSRSGTVPQIYSDNAASAGLGVRLQPEGYNASLSAESNLAFNLMRGEEHPRGTEADFRAVLADYHYWNARLLGPLGILTLGRLRPRRAFSDISGTLGYYSRYRDNVIGDLTLREGFRVWDDGTTVVSAYWPFHVLKDSNRDFFNNLAEGGFGLELQPVLRINLKLRAELIHGVYFGITGRDPNPYGPNYDDFRLTLLYSARFTSPKW